MANECTKRIHDVREKLVELCEDVILSCKSSLCVDCEHNGIDYPKCMGVHFADHLIAHGVTVQEWISVKDRLPDKDGTYLIRFANKSICDAEYENKFGSFGYWLAIMWDEDADWFPYVDVTSWMPLPQPPKGE